MLRKETGKIVLLVAALLAILGGVVVLDQGPFNQKLLDPPSKAEGPSPGVGGRWTLRPDTSTKQLNDTHYNITTELWISGKAGAVKAVKGICLVYLSEANETIYKKDLESSRSPGRSKGPALQLTLERPPEKVLVGYKRVDFTVRFAAHRESFNNTFAINETRHNGERPVYVRNGTKVYGYRHAVGETLAHGEEIGYHYHTQYTEYDPIELCR
jgi:hypothetical protein